MIEDKELGVIIVARPRRGPIADFFHKIWCLTLSVAIVIGLPFFIAWLLGVL